LSFQAITACAAPWCQLSLSRAGLEAKEITSVSGDKSESSLQSYCAPNHNERQRWSNILAGEGTSTPSHRQREREWWEGISSETKGTRETFSTEEGIQININKRQQQPRVKRLPSPKSLVTLVYYI